MKKKKKVAGLLGRSPGSSYLNLVWGCLAIAVWVGAQAWRAHQGTSFSGLVFLKGLLLLALATTVYQVSVFSKGPSFLGFFPLLWLSASRFQWSLCAGEDYRPWLWLGLFLASEILILKILDGKKLLLVLAPLWTLMTGLFIVSVLMPLTFWTGSSRRFKSATWVRWGGLGLTLGLSIVFRSWNRLNLIFTAWLRDVSLPLVLFLVAWFFLFYFPVLWLKRANPSLSQRRLFSAINSVVVLVPLFVIAVFSAFGGMSYAPLYHLLITDHFIGFFLLGWLGWIAFPLGGNYRFTLWSVLFLAVGFLFWAGLPPVQGEMELLSWVLIWTAGFGWESVRRDLMDPSWHGRLLWAALGAMFFSGVI